MQKSLLNYFYIILIAIIPFGSLAQQTESFQKQNEEQTPIKETEQIRLETQEDTTLNNSADPIDTTGIFRKYTGIMGSFSYGWSLLNIDDLNQTLNSNNYPVFSDYAVAFGGNFLRMNSCFLVGAEGYFIFTETKNQTDFDASLNSGYMFFNLGYRTIASSKVLAYPLIGIGRGRSNLKIAEKANGVLFNQLLASPSPSLELSTNSFLLSFSLNMNYFTTPIHLNGFHFGVSLGYVLSLPTEGWYKFNANIPGGPVFNLGGPFLRLKFGGGVFRAS
ncbi:MAG: hypothetical protein H0V01_15840 [Bacteroidetes bacterium]|nr:hypothetical protein [Bacteroidota bacterium]HET6244248.1 hypothetical protein [Bacteroidia bacterium]